MRAYVALLLCLGSGLSALAEDCEPWCPWQWNYRTVLGGRVVIDIVYDPETVTVRGAGACSSALASASGTRVECDGSAVGYPSQGGGNSDCDLPSEPGGWCLNRSGADACATPVCQDGGHWNLCTHAQTWEPHPQNWEMCTSDNLMEACPLFCPDPPPGHWVAQPGSGGGGAGATYSFIVEPAARFVPGGDGWVANWSGYLTDPAWASTQDPALRRLIVAWDAGSPHTAALWFAGDYRLPENLTWAYAPEIGEYAWCYEAVVTGGLGAFEFETRHRGFDDHSMDVTTYLGWTIDETRFNIADVEALEWIMVNTPGDQEALRRWDINGSQSIDSEDVAWLEQLVGAGYDSGFRCDLDGDRLPDCGNRELIAQMFGHVLGEPEYRVELDLGEWEPPPHDPNYPVPPNGPDGDNDVADLARFMTCLCPWALGDMNCDGVVGFGDINPFVLALSGQQQYELAFPNCRWLNGDMNCDGTVSLADQNLFIACVVAGGGCHCPE